MHNAIETEGLVKRYGAVTAVDGLSLCVQGGEIYAFLGLNGAGKTTTIRMLLGMVRPTAGQARLLGQPVQGGKGPWERVGYLVETADAYPELSVRENLEALRRLRPGAPPQAVDQAIERLGLGAYANRRAGTLSHGNKQRLGLAKALLHKPELVLLDEPANGLDPAGIVEIRALLQALSQEQGVTVFMSSHILGEVARLAKRIGIIHQGRLLRELDVAQLEQERRHKLLVQTRQDGPALQALQAAGYAAVQVNGRIEVSSQAAIREPEQIATCLVQAGCPPHLLQVEEEDLEAYFLRLVGALPAGAESEAGQ
jgi:ABC-2 type transport system ATP-binding protein